MQQQAVKESNLPSSLAAVKSPADLQGGATGPSTVSFKRVAILRPGEFSDSRGRNITLSAGDLIDLAAAFDPRWYSPVLTIDHADSGPSLGTVVALHWDGRYLTADIAQVPAALGEQISHGRYPYRSAELLREPGGPWQLRAVSLLGARPPAVKGLPAFPSAERNTPSKASAGAAFSETRALSALIRIDPVRHFTEDRSLEESPMETEVLADFGGTSSETAAETLLLSAENLRLSQENRQLREERVRSEVSQFMAALRSRGQLTPALERTGIEEALVATEVSGQQIELPSGETALFSTLLRELLSGLPVHVLPGLHAAAPAQGGSAVLSSAEEEIARQLGLSRDEYASVKRGDF